MERIDKIFCLGNFGIEFVKVGKNLYKYYGGSGYRFSLFASFYSPLVVFSIAGPYKKWQKIIKLLQSYKVDTRNIIHSQKEIKFITSYDSKREKQVNYEIKNRDIMRKMCKFSNKLKFQKGVLFHICPLDFEVQRKYVEMAKKKSALVSMQFHFSSINGKKTEDYVNLIKKVDYLFLNKKKKQKKSFQSKDI